MKLVTIREASQYLQLSCLSVYRLCRLQLIPAVKVGGSWRVDLELLDKKIDKKIESKND